MADENDDLRASVAAAFEKSEQEPEPTPEPAPEASSPEVAKPETPIGAETKGERARDPETGRFIPKDAVSDAAPPDPTPKAAAPSEPAEPAPAPAAAPPKPPPADGAFRGPSSWKPTAREKLRDADPEIREEALRLDREVRRTMQESAEAKQGYQRFQETFRPLEPMLRAQGLDAHAFTQDAVQTALALSVGPPETKAQAVARLIQIYGVDIQTLANVLERGGVPQAAQAPYRDPRVDQLLQTVEQARAERDRALEEQARAGIAEIEQEEFFEDLRDDIADLLELAAKRNLALTPKEAYNRAVVMNPEISRVLKQREEAQRLAGNPNGSTQRARAAASSVRASPEVAVVTPQPDRSLRDEVAAAWDAAGKSR